MGDRTEEADRLSREDRHGEALEILRGVLAEEPEDAAANLSYARILDSLGRAREAIPHYERAIAGGLPEDEMQAATVGLGGSYRAAGRPAEAVELLRRSLARFPENQALRAFLAMGLHDLGEYRESTEILLHSLPALSSDAWIAHYERAIDRYADALEGGSPGAAAAAGTKGSRGVPAAGVAGPHESLRRAIRRELIIRELVEHLPPPAKVIDVGGGAGRIAVPLARMGCELTILDPSREALGRAREALDEEAAVTRRRVRLVPGCGEEAPDLFGEATFDAATCHGVLPFVEDPEPLLQALVKLVRPGGSISVLAKNAGALAMRPALQGRYRKALHSLDANRDEGPLGAPTRADTVAGLRGTLEAAGAELIGWRGVRIFTDHLGDAPVIPEVLEDVLELEWEAGQKDPYRGVARWIHLLARRVPG